ncbi:MAG TPA: DoxX family protein [Acidimicrobiales bacterium]|nr:DoxX family protein [Acidimicrobiales bacterium]
MAVTDSDDGQDDPVAADGARLAALMLGSGVVHLLAPQLYEPAVPRWAGDPRRVVLVSGVAELACGALLLVPGTRRLGGWATAALLVGVLPANVQMVLDAGTERQAMPTVPAGLYRAACLARLPLQVPLVRRALRIARAGRA